MSKSHLVQQQPLLRGILKKPIIPYRKRGSLRRARERKIMASSFLHLYLICLKCLVVDKMCFGGSYKKAEADWEASVLKRYMSSRDIDF